MTWKNHFKTNLKNWLLEKDNPSVRYFTLKDILGKPQNDTVLAAAKAAIMTDGLVPKILAKQHKGGYWEKNE